MRSAAELAELVGWNGSGSTSADWTAIERAVETRLPSDYKDYAARFPTGEFQTYLTVPVIDDSGLAPELPELRRMLERSARTSPEPQYEVYPAAGGLLPWGYIAVDEIFCWDTTPENPDDWETVVCTIDLKATDRYPGTMTACIYDLILGRSGLQIGAMEELAEVPPTFGPLDFDAGISEDRVAEPNPSYWTDAFFPFPLEGAPDAASEIGELVGRRAQQERIDWAAFEQVIDLHLPNDYKRLVELVGPGPVGAVVLTTPYSPDPDLSLESLIERIHRKGIAKREKSSGTYTAPFFPEQGGVIPWGWNRGGWTLAWHVLGPHPQEWPVIMLDEDLSSEHLFPFTATGFLYHHVSNPQWMEQNTNDDSWQINN